MCTVPYKTCCCESNERGRCILQPKGGQGEDVVGLYVTTSFRVFIKIQVRNTISICSFVKGNAIL